MSNSASSKPWVPYIYKIKFQIGNHKPYYYIGCRYARGCHPNELFKDRGYFTSSKKILSMIKLYDLKCFSTEIIQTFDVNKIISEKSLQDISVGDIIPLEKDDFELVKRIVLVEEARLLESVGARQNRYYLNRCNGIFDKAAFRR